MSNSGRFFLSFRDIDRGKGKEPLASEQELKVADRVRWSTSQGMTTGHVKKKLTEPADVKGYYAAASQEEPQFFA